MSRYEFAFTVHVRLDDPEHRNAAAGLVEHVLTAAGCALSEVRIGSMLPASTDTVTCTGTATAYAESIMELAQRLPERLFLERVTEEPFT